MKLKCKCGKLATWFYMPSEEEWVCCDDCVPRGCTCHEYNWKEFQPEGVEGKDWAWLNKEEIYEKLDVEGNSLPCIEWWYDEKGWEDETPKT